uniref:Oligosaccharide repeat unit polymerase n=1 Tax=Dictyoglomus thermophilum TaxID=14 RepID=A0A7C3MLS4_DICTH
MIIFPIIFLLLLSTFAKIYFRTWLAPGCLFSVIWLLYIIMSVIFAPDLPISSISLWVIVFSIFSLITGSMLVFPINKRLIPSKIDSDLEIVNRILYNILIYFSVFSLIGVLLIFSNGIRRYSLSGIFEGLWKLGYFYSYARYKEKWVPPLELRILTYFLYPSALIGGYIFEYFKNWKKFITLFPILIMVLFSLIVAARAGLYLVISIWISGFISYKLLKYGEKYKFMTLKNIFLFIIIMVILIFIYVFLQNIRIGNNLISTSSLYDIYQNSKVAIWGSLSAFSIWFENANLFSFAGGSYTFAGIFDILGIESREQGLYSEPIYFSSGKFTNIYTIFRALIDDYSIIGMFVFWFIVGMLSTYAYVKTCKGKIIWSIVLSAFYSMTFFSNLYSIFIFNSILFSWISIIFLFYFLVYWKSIKRFIFVSFYRFNMERRRSFR